MLLTNFYVSGDLHTKIKEFLIKIKIQFLIEFSFQTPKSLAH